ncbi:MAG: HAMP domain-containing histidine kinase, partial [Phycisphaerales bacterium]|nr:HAMP domain-containing histidine kinase [Phycisphaerales bacterium]
TTTRQETEGTGLGLSIARGIARDHGGDITCANRPDGGALFRLEFPVRGPAPAAQA